MTLTEFYERECRANTAISAHLPRLRELAEGCDVAVEFGVKRGASSSALLLGAKSVISFDIQPTDQALLLKQIAPHWDYRLEDSRTADVPECDLLFVDSLHTYAQVRDELAHADKVRRLIAFHDVTTFGEVGAVGETGRQAWTYSPGKMLPAQHAGIRPAIDELMVRDDSWRIKARHVDSHGLLVLERR